jgi:hypothetical protein
MFLASNCTCDAHVSAITICSPFCAAVSSSFNFCTFAAAIATIFLLILVMDFFLIVLRSRPCDAHISAIAALVSAAASSSSNSCAFAAALATVVFVFVVDFDD